MEQAAGGVTVCDARSGSSIPASLLAELAACGAKTLSLVQERALCRENPPELVEVSLIDDAEIARVHGEFLDDPTPTDVITFPYGKTGEILVSVETAERHSKDYGKGLDAELALYLVHGLLHLCGYEDASEPGRKEMTRLQEELVDLCFRRD